MEVVFVMIQLFPDVHTSIAINMTWPHCNDRIDTRQYERNLGMKKGREVDLALLGVAL